MNGKDVKAHSRPNVNYPYKPQPIESENCLKPPPPPPGVWVDNELVLFLSFEGVYVA